MASSSKAVSSPPTGGGLKVEPIDPAATERQLQASWATPLAVVTGIAMTIALIFSVLPGPSAVAPRQAIPAIAGPNHLEQAAELAVDKGLARIAARLAALAPPPALSRKRQIAGFAAGEGRLSALYFRSSGIPEAAAPLSLADRAAIAAGIASGDSLLRIGEQPAVMTVFPLSRIRPRGDAPMRGRLPEAGIVVIEPLSAASVLAQSGAQLPEKAVETALLARIGVRRMEVVQAIEPPQPPVPDFLSRLDWPTLTALCLGLFGALLQLVYARRQAALSKGIVQQIENRALDRAMRDPLTGLRNRSGFRLKLDQAAAERTGDMPLGVIYIDLDRFKEVNDSYGHDMGDKLLVAVTKRLGAMCLREETLARLGGDEFAMIVQGHESAEAIAAFGSAISSELGIPFNLDGTQVNIGGSVGVAVAPEDGVEPAELVRRADISMYRSKAAGRGQSHRFHASMEDEVRRRAFLEAELRKAIDRNELDVYYQPVVGPDGETFIGVEALIRWKHHVEGWISPAVFIPLAEQTGLIQPISEWMMKKAMIDIRPIDGISLALNVSPMQFKQENLVQSVVDIAHDTGMEIDRLEVEVTEGVLVDDSDHAVEIIESFRKAGFKVALDDFGTGYASLSYLKRFRFDKLKIDQVFVRNLAIGSGAGAIVHAVVALGRALGLTVQAEGVESLEHHIFLRAAGCHTLQGYYFARPMPLKDLLAFAEKHRTPALRYMHLRRA